MRYVLLVALSAMLATGPASAQAPDAAEQPEEHAEIAVDAEVMASRTATRKFGATLKEALQQAIKTGGPANGITVCHDQAAQIAARLSEELEMLVGRTSLKIRNPNHTPDAWETAVLKQFEARKAQGEPVDQLEFFAVIDDDQGQQTFRYMKAIPTVGLCLNCHGENLAPEVDAELRKLYPYDKARGFREGDLRGAFTIAKPLP